MKPKIKIISSTGKWTNVIYMASSAKVRMTTEKLKESYENGTIELVNPTKLEE